MIAEEEAAGGGSATAQEPGEEGFEFETAVAVAAARGVVKRR
jgi:hypothetical protein